MLNSQRSLFAIHNYRIFSHLLFHEQLPISYTTGKNNLEHSLREQQRYIEHPRKKLLSPRLAVVVSVGI